MAHAPLPSAGGRAIRAQNTAANTAGLKAPWQPGQSGNPGGRPRLPAEFKQHGPDALNKLVALMDSADERIALEASTRVADRIFGKPTQPLEIDREALAIFAAQAEREFGVAREQYIADIEQERKRLRGAA